MALRPRDKASLFSAGKFGRIGGGDGSMEGPRGRRGLCVAAGARPGPKGLQDPRGF
jgi:hypothetical protein